MALGAGVREGPSCVVHVSSARLHTHALGGASSVARPPRPHLHPRACSFSSTSCWKPLVLGGSSSKRREMAARLVEGCALDGRSFTSASAAGQSGVGAPSFQGCRGRPPSWWKGESGPVTGEMGGEVLGKPSAVAAVASPPV